MTERQRARMVHVTIKWRTIARARLFISRLEARNESNQRAILELYHSLGGNIITYGSDSHSTVRTGDFFGETMEMLKQVGFDYVYTFKNRKAKAHEIDVD